MRNQKRVPLRGLKNFGPVTATEFASMGLEFLDQVEALGFEDTCRKWIQYYPERLNANAFLAVVCALDGVVWTKATVEHRRQAHALVAQLRHELGLPRVPRAKAKFTKSS